MRPQIENGPIPMVQSFIDQTECILCFCSLDLVSTIYSFERFYRARLGWHFVWVRYPALLPNEDS